MNRILFVIIISIAGASVAFCQSVPKDSSVRKHLIDLEHKLATAVSIGDKKSFDNLTHNNYVERYDQNEMTKATILSELKPHPEVKFDYSILSVDVYGNAAVLRGMGIYTIDTTSNEKIYTMFSDIFIKEKTGWKIANSHASSVPSWIAVVPGDNDLVDSVTVVRCEEEAKQRSVSYDQPAFIRFKNAGTSEVTIEWISYEGKRDLKKSLEAGKSYDIKTFQTHPFIVTGVNNKCYGIFVAVKKPGLVIIK